MYTASYFTLYCHRHVSALIEPSSGTHNSYTYVICEYGFSLMYAATVSLHVQGVMVQYKAQFSQFNI